MGQRTQGLTLQRVADVIDAGEQASPVPGHLPAQVLHALAALVPCDFVSYADFDIDVETHYAMDDLERGTEVTYLPEPLVDRGHEFWSAYVASRYCSYPTRTGDHRSVTMLSDFYSVREWKQTAMYDGLRQWSPVRELMCPLPGFGGRTKRLLFSRAMSADFTEEDRFALALLRPHLIEMVGRRSASAAAATLTGRQQELMRLVAEGHTNAEIAALLHLSPHTVRTHLANIFEKLGVSMRSAAVARVFST
jgi:DNA-binding CsgD family transcriptional regulator